MKKNIILWCCIIVLIIGGCSKNESSEPSYKDIDWFQISDDSDDPLRPLIYDTYKKTGIPVFCNDTIGRQIQGVSADGEPIIYYEVLCVNYNLTSNTETAQYVLEHDRKNLESGIKLMRDTLFPRIPKVIHIHSCFLVKSLKVLKLGVYEVVDGFCGFNTFVIGRMDQVAEMGSDDRFDLAMDALSVLVSEYLVNNSDEELQPFYAVSNNIPFTGKGPIDIYLDWVDYYDSDPLPWEALGFLGYDRGDQYSFMPYSKLKDLQIYISAYLRMSEPDFAYRYRFRKYILEKYAIVKDLMTELYAKA